MFDNYLIANKYGFNGIYRAKLLTNVDDSDIRVYVPGINSINPLDSNGNIDITKYEKNKLSYPVVQWCCYNLESKELVNIKGPAWVMFENGDVQRPVCISYAVIGGESENGGGSGTSSSTGNGTFTTVAGDGGDINSRSFNVIETAIQYWYSDCNGKAYGRGSGQYDCSSSTTHAFIKAGLSLPSYYGTGDGIQPYISAGFRDVTSETGTSSYSKLKRGDVLWRKGHMCIYLGEGKTTAASHSKGNTVGNWYDFAETVLRYGG